jgi:hypothetical protein
MKFSYGPCSEEAAYSFEKVNPKPDIDIKVAVPGVKFAMAPPDSQVHLQSIWTLNILSATHNSAATLASRQMESAINS